MTSTPSVSQHIHLGGNRAASIWAMAVMVVSVTAFLANSISGRWSAIASTIRRLVRQPAPGLAS